MDTKNLIDNNLSDDKLSIVITNHELDDVDISEIAHVTLAARKASHDRGILSLEKVERQLREQFNRVTPPEVLLARANGKLVGWLCFYEYNSHYAHVWNWHPDVLPGINEEDIASKLIEKSVKLAMEKGTARIFVDFVIKEEISRTNRIYDKYKSWYDKHGINKLNETVLMRRDLLEHVLESGKFPKNYEIKPLAEVDEDELYGCRYEVFMNSGDRSFLELTVRERLDTFTSNIIRSEDLNEEASLVLLKDKEIVGFSVVHFRSHEGYLRSFGIHPDHRRKKLGKALLQLSMNIIKQQGMKSMSLDVDIENRPAYDFYLNLGFKTISRVISHSRQVV
ncbi:MAG: GNAT family N-acetyltransferase [Candidatus Hodarchaeales archaeon]